MKTFRMIGIALFAVLMCVNFASCGNDDGEIPSDPTGDSPTNQPTNEKKLVQVMIYDDEEALEEIIEFKYDENGNLIKADESGGETLNYIWESNNSVTCKWDMEDEDFVKYSLTNGKVTRIQTHELSYNPIIGEYDGYYDYYGYFDYDKDGHLKEIGGEYDGEKEPSYSYTWDNGNLTSFDSKRCFYDYKTYKGFFPLFFDYVGFNKEEYIFMALPELVGIKTKNLPKMIIDGSNTYTFEYEFNQDNYIISCTVNKEDGGDYSYNEEYYYEFVWE